jgi:hypothetical protein
LGIYDQQEIADAVDEAAQIYKEEVPPDEQSGNGLSEVLDAVVKKTTEELGHKFNKQQSIANPALGKEFLEEVISFSPTFGIACIHFSTFSEFMIKFTPPSILMTFVSGY